MEEIRLMKTLFKVLTLAVVITAFSALTFAQDDNGNKLKALYDQFRTEIKAKCGERAPALTTGRTIIDTFEPKSGETDAAKLEFYNLNKPVIDFVKTRVGAIQKEDPACKRSTAYNDKYTAKDWAGFFAAGKDVITAEGPDSGVTLDVMLDLVSVGYDRAVVDKIDTFNAETLSYAKTALDRIQAGKPSSTGKYGVFVPFNTKDEAQSWLNYIIGWEMYNKMNQKKDALPYFYKAAQVGTAKKNDTTVYTNIGQYYLEEAIALEAKYRELRKANNNEDNDETRALLALARGTADRASDAFGRAYKIASADPKLATLKTNIAKTLTDLYKFRFNLADAKQADIDKYVAALVAKPMPDPSSAVTPVVEATPTTTTTTSTTSTTLNTTNAATTTTPTPAATTNSTKTTPTTKTTPKTTTTVKKPVKKKGTR